MNRDQANSLVCQTFTHSFNKNQFLNFNHNLLNHLDTSKAAMWNRQDIKSVFKEHIRDCERLGTYTSPKKETVDVLIVYLTHESKLERARSSIRNFVADHLKTGDEKDAALVAFVSPSENTWRFSYVKMEYSSIEKDSGKVAIETHLTSARRFSYIVGQGESCHTAQTRFLDLLQDTETDPILADIEAAFSVEAVTEEFFRKYVELFEEIQKALVKLVDKNQPIHDEFSSRSINTIDFAKKLMGQIVFLYFLQKKGWLGVEKEQDWGHGPRDFMRRLVKAEYGKYGNFFNEILQPLFYDTLATDRGHEAWCNKFGCRIPFLNGGLFEPLGDYDWTKTTIILPNKLFFNSEYVDEGIVGTGVFDVFDRYNFTVNEAEPLEKEVAIDPEMLGKVFENLIEENRRKGLGAFYTPREIVHYMCQESLINYLYTTIKDEKQITASHTEVETFIHLGEQISHYESADTFIKMPECIGKNARLIDEKLAEITVCDPAVGSGAFPVGMMTEIVRARCSLTPYFNSVEERTPYHFKRHAIQNCLYGVDIDSGAVEIAKLRLWLSLVVDEENVKQIKPLPNLDYKVVVGNSLFGVEKNLFNVGYFNRLEAVKPLYFDESDKTKKNAYKHEINELIYKITNNRQTFDFEIYFSEVFHRKGGFDLVIGNPPYIRVHKQDAAQKQALRMIYKSPYQDFDIYIVFIEKSLLVLKTNGLLSFITPDKFLVREYGQEIRKIILKNRIVELYDISRADDAFGAAVYPLISLIQKTQACSMSRIRFAKSVKNLDSPKNEYLHPQSDWQKSNIIQLMVDSDFNVLEKVTKNSITLGDLLGQDAIFCGTPRAKDYYEWAKGLVERRTVKTPRVLVCSNLTPYCIDHGKIVRTMGERIKGPYFDNSKKLVGENRWSSFLQKPKILIRGNDTRITAVLDDQASVFIGIYGIRLTNTTTRIAKFLVAALNSSLYQWTFLTRNPSLKIGGGFFSINAPQLLALPFRNPSEKTLNLVSRAFDQIVEAKQRDINADTALWEKEIDGLIYSLYDLTPEDIALVEGNPE